MKLFIREQDIYCKCEECQGEGTVEETKGGWDSPNIVDVECEYCNGQGVIDWETMFDKAGNTFDPCEVFEAYDSRGKFLGFSYYSTEGEMESYSDFEEAKFHFKNQ